MIKPIYVNNVRIFPFKDFNMLMDYVNKEKGILVAINAEKILHATEKTRKIINNNIGYPDGIGAVWAIKKQGIKNVSRIPGVELWLEIIKKYYKTKSFYLIGATENIINQVVIKLKEDFPEINILGYRNGYINTDKERKILIQTINHKKPEIVFVAMGSPAQELLMQEMFENHPAIYQGLGGSFDVYTGKVKRAPFFFQKLNLEWLYRWLKQPVTRTKRNLQLSMFIYKLYLNKF